MRCVLDRREVGLNRLQTLDDTIVRIEQVRQGQVSLGNTLKTRCGCDRLLLATRRRGTRDLDKVRARKCDIARVKRHKSRAIPNNIVTRMDLQRRTETCPRQVTRSGIGCDGLNMPEMADRRIVNRCGRAIVCRHIGKRALEDHAHRR